MKSRINNYAFLFLILIILGVALWAMRMPQSNADKETYSTVRDLFEAEKVNEKGISSWLYRFNRQQYS